MNFVLYLTKRCDMKCSYCFEKEFLSSNPKDDMTIQEVVKFIDFANETDPNGNLTIFGGEPFTNPELVYRTIRYADKFGLRMSIYTNGLYLSQDNNLLEFLKNTYRLKNNLLLGISYDGNYNYRRTNKSNTLRIEKLLFKCKNLKEKGLLNFGISYTVRHDNYSKFIPELYFLEDTFNPTKIDVAFDAEDLGFKTYSEVCERVMEQDLNFKGKVCSIACKQCKQCTGSKDDVTYHCYKDKFLKGNSISNKEIFK